MEFTLRIRAFDANDNLGGGLIRLAIIHCGPVRGVTDALHGSAT